MSSKRITPLVLVAVASLVLVSGKHTIPFRFYCPGPDNYYKAVEQKDHHTTGSHRRHFTGTDVWETHTGETRFLFVLLPGPRQP